MSYIVFARKYRPQTFDDIVGQPHVTTTLKNAISQDRIAHAYLFAGPRGVGKTTTARIFAKALNCEKGPAVNFCNACSTCKEIAQGTNLDVLEIDGASNRGIDEIRNLRDNVKFAPSCGKFKIYIIDEVHMLTPEAFNALLKTLEEPPPHVKFIFATTQAHKVPATILSRCQRFDFRRISTRDILGNLKAIVKAENLAVKDEALALVAKYSDGSMRDAQVILDQVTSFNSGAVGLEDVSKMLGVLEDDVFFGLSGSVRERDAVAALKIVDRLVNEGKDVMQVVLGLIEHFRNLAMVKISDDLSSLIEADSEKIKAYAAESQRFTIEEILYIIYTLSNTIDFIKKSSLARIPFEAAVIKLTQRDSIINLDRLIERMGGLGKDNRPEEGLPLQDKANLRSSTALTEEAAPRPPEKKEDPGIKASAGPNESAKSSSDLEDILASWGGVINYITPRRISIASYLQEGYPVRLEANTLYIGFPKEFQFHKEVLESPENRRLIEEAVRETLKQELRVGLVLVEPLDIQRQGANGNSMNQEGEDSADKETPAKQNVEPIVKTALEIFGGDISAKE